MLSGIYIDELLSLMQEAYKNVYIIRLVQRDIWYFHDINDDTQPQGIVWTPHMAHARAFSTEESVEEFKMAFISPRKVEILRIEREA